MVLSMCYTFKNFYATCTEANAKHARFKLCNSLRNRSRIYAKIHTHLRYFGLYFTQKSARAITRAWLDTCDFYGVIFGPHSSLRNRSMIYAKICTHLRCFASRFTQKNRPSQNLRTIGRARFLRRNFWVSFAVTKQINDLCYFGARFTLKSTRVRIRVRRVRFSCRNFWAPFTVSKLIYDLR